MKIIAAIWMAVCLSASAYPENFTLCYHQFDLSLNNVYSVIPEVLEWQVSYLRDNHIEIIPLSNMVEAYTRTGNIGTNVLMTIDDGWTNNWNIIPFVEKEKVPMTIFLIANGPNITNSYFTMADIEKLKAIPELSFGSHSFSHIPLVRKSDQVLWKEIVESRTILEKQLGRKVDTFAYPYGAYDAKTQKLAGKTYTLSFGIENGPNTAKQPRSDIRRDVIYRTTTFGEFIDAIDTIHGRQPDKGYHMVNMGMGTESIRYFNFVKVRLYEFPAKKSKRTFLIIPGAAIGPAWFYKTIDSLTNSGIQTCVMVPRNNNVPYWRPDHEMKVITNWNLEQFQQDLKNTLDYLNKDDREIVVLTWNEGFDILVSTLLRYKNSGSNIKGVFGINPSLREEPQVPNFFGIRLDFLNRKISSGDFTNESLNFFIQVKTLSDLAILKPDQASSYSSSMGYGYLSNYDMLKAFIDNQSDPDLSLDSLDEHYTMTEFHQAFFKPLPVFSMLIPITLEHDINELWARDFYWKEKQITGKESLKIPVYYIYSTGHLPTFTRLTNTFGGMDVEGDIYFEGLSTVELLLSKQVSDLVTNKLNQWFL
jgi:peptidoglycan/xylan/chitin deacetylase (PgdA/CDA1 family)